MAEDIWFKIQLGIVLPRLKSEVAPVITPILEDLVEKVKEGTLEGEKAGFEDVKEVFIKDLNIFLDTTVFPGIREKLEPPPPPPPEPSEAEETPDAE